MEINPTAGNGANRIDQAAVEGQRAARQAAEEAQARQQQAEAAAEADNEPRNDSADLSSTARALARDTEARPPEAKIDPARLQEIGERLASGYYDRPEVIEQVAERLHQDPEFRGR